MQMNNHEPGRLLLYYDMTLWCFLTGDNMVLLQALLQQSLSTTHVRVIRLFNEDTESNKLCSSLMSSEM